MYYTQWARDGIPYVLKEFFGVKDGLYSRRRDCHFDDTPV